MDRFYGIFFAVAAIAVLIIAFAPTKRDFEHLIKRFRFW